MCNILSWLIIVICNCQDFIILLSICITDEKLCLISCKTWTYIMPFSESGYKLHCHLARIQRDTINDLLSTYMALANFRSALSASLHFNNLLLVIECKWSSKNLLGFLDFTMCPQPKAKSFSLLKQIVQLCNCVKVTLVPW
jgi:hypothetical protein